MTQLLTTPAATPANRKRFTRSDCDFMERAGLLTERYELIDGEIIVKVGQNQPHAVTITLLIRWLIFVFGGEFVLCQLPIEVKNADRTTNRPEPDAAVLAQPVTAYLQNAPGPGDLRLVVEVSDSTLRDDLETKAALYARAGVPEYWVLDVPSRRLIVHRDLSGERYADVKPFANEQTIAPQAAPSQLVRVAELLPPAAPQTT